MGDNLFDKLLANQAYFFDFARNISERFGDDAVQDAFIKLYRKKDSLSEGNLQAYMRMAIKHSIIDASRKPQNKEIALDIDIAVEELRDSVDPDLCFFVRQAIDQLPSHYKTILNDVCEGFSYSEVASKYDIPLGTVMSRLARARIIVKNKIKKYLN